MRAEHVNPFIGEFIRIFKEVTGTELTLAKAFRRSPLAPNESVKVLLQVIGNIEGEITMQLTKETAQNIASSMMGGITITEMNEIVKSAIAELGNMITGSASSIIADSGVTVDITPPEVLIDAGVVYTLSDHNPILAFIFDMGTQKIELDITLKEAC